MKHLYNSLLLFVLAITSCETLTPDNGNSSSTEPDLPAPSIFISSAEPVISSDGGNAVISFNSTDQWVAAVNVDWVSLSAYRGDPGNNVISINVKENATYDQREAVIVISSDQITKQIRLTQKQLDALLVSSNSIIIDSDGGAPSFQVNANVDFSCSIEDDAKNWISIVETKSLTSNTVLLSIEKNKSAESRQGNIMVKSGSKVENVTIYQAGSAQTTSLAGTSWYMGPISNNAEIFFYVCIFRVDGTFMITRSYAVYQHRNAEVAYEGRYSSSGSNYSLFFNGDSYSQTGTAEIIDNVLHICHGSSYHYVFFKL